MKKRIAAIISSILLIIVIFAVTLSVIRSKSGNGFPHYKQALIPPQGTVYGVSGSDMSVSFVFVDAIEMSEMASSENMKSVKLLLSGGKTISAKTWTVTENDNSSGYVMRYMDLKIPASCKSQGLIKTLKIEFNDGLVKSFDTGSLTLKVFDKSTYDKKNGIVTAINNFPHSRNNTLPVLSGNVMSIYTYGSNIRIDDIDLGIKGLGADYSAAKLYGKEIDINDFEAAHKKHEGYTAAFDCAKKVKRLETLKKPIEVKALSDQNAASTLLLPFEYTDDFKIKNAVTIYSVKIDYTDERTGEKHFCIDQNPYLYMPVTSSEFSGREYLKEHGI